MSEDERDGPFEKQHSDEELLEFIRQEEVVTTREVADNFDYHLQTSRRRLKQLEQDGKLEMKDAGKRMIWWVPREQLD